MHATATLLFLASGALVRINEHGDMVGEAQRLVEDTVRRVAKDLTPMTGHYAPTKFEYNPLAGVSDPRLVMAALQRAAEANPDAEAMRAPKQDADGNLVAKTRWFQHHGYEYEKTTWKQFHTQVLQAGAAYTALGLQTMDAVLIKGLNSPEWLVAFLGCIAAGGLPVGLYPTDSADVMKYKSDDSGAKFVVAGGAREAAQFQSFLEPGTAKLVMWGGEALPAWGGEQLAWADFLQRGRNREPWTPVAAHAGQVASIVYTSGTTGNPKGVMLSQDSLLWSSQTVTELIGERPDDGQDRTVSYLPLNHIAGQMLDIFGPIVRSASPGQYQTVYFPPKCFVRKTCFAPYLQDVRPTIFFGVPEVWDGLKLKLEKAMSAGGVKGFVASHAGAGFLKKQIGLNYVKYSASGAGAITKDTISFFHKLELDILNIFGQSESCGLGAVWLPTNFDLTKLGSVGQKMPGTEVKILAPDADGQGEIMLRGRHVMLGYLNKPEKSASTVDADGWLATGDKGRIDAEGWLYLTGRLKEIMKTSGGEMLAPPGMEEGVRAACNPPGDTLVRQAIVVGDGRSYPSVLVSVGDVDATTNGRLAACIAAYNKVADKGAERLYRFATIPVIDRDDEDLMTPTFKIKRTGVDARYADLIESCYSTEASRDVKPCGT